MKNLSILILFITGTLLSCDVDSTGDVSSVTNFATLETLGDPIVFNEVGTAFVEPGVIATISGEDVPFETLGDLDTNKAGIYGITYQVVNEDGFAAQASRTVYVYENNGTLAGIYDGKRVGRAGGPILVSSTGTDGTYNISDFLGGHYEFERGFGRAYAVPATITVSGSTISSPGGSNPFGPWFMANGTLSADGKTMTWRADLPSQSFGFNVEFIKSTP